MLTNPIIKNYKNFFLYIIIWLFNTLIYLSILTSLLGFSLSIALGESLVFNLLLGGLGLSFWYSARYISFENNGIFKIFFSHLVGAILASALWMTLGFIFTSIILNNNQKFSNFFYSTIPWRFLIGILFYFLITSFYYVVIYYSGFKERIAKESELKNLVTEAELKSLKFQINPHFIFNSLNSMSALTGIDPDKAKNMILKLADFLRYTLANNERQKNKLSEELKNINLYLEIEKIRFEDKFDIISNIEEKCLNISVPNMILQPLFENAIKHAVYETLDKVILKLECRLENDFMKISLSNNFETGSTSYTGTGVGLNNIKNRLKLIYNQDNLLEVNKNQDIFKVTLFIPIN
jgi:sensor histidine kinase YesM